MVTGSFVQLPAQLPYSKLHSAVDQLYIGSQQEDHKYTVTLCDPTCLKRCITFCFCTCALPHLYIALYKILWQCHSKSFLLNLWRVSGGALVHHINNMCNPPPKSSMKNCSISSCFSSHWRVSWLQD